MRGAASALALQCLADLKDIQVSCIPPVTAAAAAIHPTLSPLVIGLHDALQFMHQMFVKLCVSSALYSIHSICVSSLTIHVGTLKVDLQRTLVSGSQIFNFCTATFLCEHRHSSIHCILQLVACTGRRCPVNVRFRSFGCRISPGLGATCKNVGRRRNWIILAEQSWSTCIAGQGRTECVASIQQPRHRFGSIARAAACCRSAASTAHACTCDKSTLVFCEYRSTSCT